MSTAGAQFGEKLREMITPIRVGAAERQLTHT
jgi:hypothetical protein